MRRWNWKIRAGAGFTAAVAAIVVAGTIATLAMGGGSGATPSARAEATATPGGRIGATCLRGTICNDSSFGHDGSTELTCEEAQACPTPAYHGGSHDCPRTPSCDPCGLNSNSACPPHYACPMLPPQPLSPPAGEGGGAPECRPCVDSAPNARPGSASPSFCLPRCIEPMASETTPPSDGTEVSPPMRMPPCPEPPMCPQPAGRPSSGARAVPQSLAACADPGPRCVVPPENTPTTEDPGIALCIVPVPPCGLPVEPMASALPASPPAAPACPLPPPACDGTSPPTSPGGVEPQSAPPCVAPGCATSSDGTTACPTPGSSGGSSGASGSGVAEPGMPVEVAPAPPAAG